MAVRHTACKYCGQDIEGVSPYRKGEWRDRVNNTLCPDDSGKTHAPVAGTFEHTVMRSPTKADLAYAEVKRLRSVISEIGKLSSGYKYGDEGLRLLRIHSLCSGNS